MKRNNEPMPDVMGICIIGATENMSVTGNDVRLDSPGAGIFFDDRGGGHKDVTIADNSVTFDIPPVVEKRWSETFWVNVVSGLAVAFIMVFCGWLGLK